MTQEEAFQKIVDEGNETGKVIADTINLKIKEINSQRAIFSMSFALAYATLDLINRAKKIDPSQDHAPNIVGLIAKFVDDNLDNTDEVSDAEKN